MHLAALHGVSPFGGGGAKKYGREIKRLAKKNTRLLEGKTTWASFLGPERSAVDRASDKSDLKSLPVGVSPIPETVPLALRGHRAPRLGGWRRRARGARPRMRRLFEMK